MPVRFACSVLLTLLSLSVSAMAADPTGIWRSTITLNGQSIETMISFHLDSEGPMLTGFELDSASNRKLEIHKADCRGNQIQFVVDREPAGEKLTIHYRGEISRDVISGSAVFEHGDRKQTAIWTARRERTSGR